MMATISADNASTRNRSPPAMSTVAIPHFDGDRRSRAQRRHCRDSVQQFHQRAPAREGNQPRRRERNQEQD